MTTERMFVAITPPLAVVDAISDLPTRAQRGVRYTKRAQWHITLCFLGNCDRHRAVSALDRIESAPVEVTIGPAVSLLGARVVMVPATGLERLASHVAAEFADIGSSTDRDYAGHLTLARLKGAPQRDPSIVSVLDAPISATFTATGVDLFTSEIGENGAVHTVVGRKALEV